MPNFKSRAILFDVSIVHSFGRVNGLIPCKDSGNYTHYVFCYSQCIGVIVTINGDYFPKRYMLMGTYGVFLSYEVNILTYRIEIYKIKNSVRSWVHAMKDMTFRKANESLVCSDKTWQLSRNLHFYFHKDVKLAVSYRYINVFPFYSS
jgi:hypothetical protein